MSSSSAPATGSAPTAASEAGHSWSDTSAITGESIPLEVAPGDAVVAGSVNTSGNVAHQGGRRRARQLLDPDG